MVAMRVFYRRDDEGSEQEIEEKGGRYGLRAPEES
jgi:hypothetical protein